MKLNRSVNSIGAMLNSGQTPLAPDRFESPLSACPSARTGSVKLSSLLGSFLIL